MFDVDLKAHKATLWDGGDAAFRATNVQDIAAAVASLLTNPDAHAVAKNTHVYISSVETTQKEILTAGEEATGTKFEIENVDSDAIFKDAQSRLTGGDLSAIKTILTGIAVSKRGMSAFSMEADAGNKLLLDGNVKKTVAE